MVSRLALLIHLALLPSFILGQEYVTVDTQEGTVRGQVSQTYTGNVIYRFEGIPYAEPPVGDLRFQPPVPKAAWSGVRDALALGSQCPQYLTGAGDEDCLYLNVYTPGTQSQNGTLKPVIVWIHGGCFTKGSGAMTPDYFVDNDVVLVGLNYRLGLLGFLSTGDEVVPGNMGLKDQVEALIWVQRNIAAFGGDPDKVSILGQSAGGASIHYHVLSPLSKGLFKNGIAMSGSALNPWAFTKNASDRAIRFAQTLGYTGTSSSDLLNFLKELDVNTLASDAFSALSEEDRNTILSCVWGPTLEPDYDGAFLTEEPLRLVTEGRYNSVPYMSGLTDLEELATTQPNGVLSTEAQVSNLNENFDEIVGCDLRLPTRGERLSAALTIKQFYYNGSDITLQDNYTTALFVSHLFFSEGVDTVIRNMARHSSEPVYYYEFTFVGSLSAFPGGPGAAHADDTHYIFPSAILDPNTEEGLIRDQMVALWTNFAKYDNPTPEDSSLLAVTWGEYDSSSPNYLEIAVPLRNRTNLLGPYMSFWHNLLPSFFNPTPEDSSLLAVTWGEYDSSSPNYLEIAVPLRNRTNLLGPYMSFWHNLLPSFL